MTIDKQSLLDKANEKRCLLCNDNGDRVFLVYRQGNPNDVFQSTWLTTDPEIKECSDWDFQYPNLIGIDTPAHRLLELADTAEGKAFADKITSAIDEGHITFPPDNPGKWQAGYRQ